MRHLLQVSSVCRAVDGHVSRVFGDVGVRAVFQQQADDGWISAGRRFVEDGRVIVRLREDVCACGRTAVRAAASEPNAITSAFPLTFHQERLHHLQVTVLGGQGQWREAVVAAGVRLRPGLQQHLYHLCCAQPGGLVQRPAAVAGLLVHTGALQEQQLQQVQALSADRCREAVRTGELQWRSASARRPHAVLPANSGASCSSSWLSGSAPCFRRKEAFSMRPPPTARSSGV